MRKQKTKSSNRKTELKKGIIKKDVFDREMALCKKLSQEHKGKCGWGECKKCGVVPLLYKLREGKLLENPNEIKGVKDKILNQRFYEQRRIQ